jgi:hypothetical protein
LAVTFLAGARKVADLSQIQKPDYDEMMYLLDPDNMTLPYIMKQFNTKGWKGNRAFSFFEDKYMPRFTTLAADATAAATALTVATGAGEYFRRMCVARNERTGECFLVTQKTDPTDDTLDVVVRGTNIGTTASAPMLTGDVIRIMENIVSESQYVGDTRLTKENLVTNYIEEFETAITMTQDAIEAQNYTGKTWDYHINKSLKEHAHKLSDAFWFGEPKLYTTYNQTTSGQIGGVLNSTGSTIWKMGGILYYISGADLERRPSAPAGMTQTWFIDNVLGPAFEYGSEDKVALCCDQALMGMGKWKWDKKRFTSSNETVMNLNLMEVDSPIGMLKMKRCRQLNPAPNAPLPLTSDYGGRMVILDMSKEAGLAYKEAQSTEKDDVVLANIPQGKRAKAQVITSKCSLEFPNPNNHFMLTGITTTA